MGFHSGNSNDSAFLPADLGYEDMLKDFATVGDLKWSLGTHGPSQNPANLNYSAIKDRVLHSDRLADMISKLLAANRQGPVKEEILHKVRRILDEMGHAYNIRYVRFLGYILIKAVRRMYEHVWINTEALQELQPLFSVPNVPVIFMPTHRSYADFLLVSFVAFHYGLPLPVIASGIDFLGMFGVGEILRKCGAFFIRRSFSDDPVYRAVFSEYIRVILSQPQPLEFFAEGTRSRSAKSIYPKFGLLQAAVETFLMGGVTDIIIIPISITYERTLEENLYARELLGVPKPRESTSGLLKARRVLNDNYGSMWFHFGKPMSVRNFMATKVDRSLHNTVPRTRLSLSVEENGAVRSLAFAVIREQQANIKIHDCSIIATVLLHRLRRKELTISVHDLMQDTNLLVRVIRQTAPGHESRRHFGIESLQHCLKIHKAIIRLSSDASYVEFKPEYLEDMKLLHMLLAHYRNQLMHRVVPQVLGHLVSKTKSNGDPRMFLHQLFSREFVLSSEDITEEFAKMDSFPHEDTRILETLVEPFLTGYSMILHLLQSNQFASQSIFRTAKELGLLLQKYMGKVLDTGVYGGYEILSSDLISNCLQALRAMDAIQLRNDQLFLNINSLSDVCFELNAFMPVEILLAVTGAIENDLGDIVTGAKI